MEKPIKLHYRKTICGVEPKRHYFVYFVYTQEQFEKACPSKLKRAVIRVMSLLLPRVLKVKIIK